MKQFIAFSKKEFYESSATFRIHILFAVFLIFGIMSPLLAKLTPEIIKSLGDTGVIIQVPEPTALDSWAQFFKNIGQMGILVIVIMFCGIMSNELSKGTLINLLTKGLKRNTVILSKFFVATILWLLAYLLCLGVCFAYTAYFWDIGDMNNALLAFAAPWLFGEFIIALLIFGGTIFGNIYGSLLSCLSMVIVLNIASIFPKTAEFNPITLSGGTLSLLSRAGKPEDFIPAVIICLALTVGLVVASMVIFNKKKV
jgi:ABC-2 type transport system permease protein